MNKIRTIFKFVILFSLLSLFSPKNIFAAGTSCAVTKEQISSIILAVQLNRDLVVRQLSNCEKANRNLMAELINIDPDYFLYADETLQDDENFIREFVAQNPRILRYISLRLKADQYFMENMAHLYSDALEYADHQLTDNKIFMTKMIAKNPRNFSFASERLQNEFDIALLAVNKSGKMLKFASQERQNDKKIVKAAVSAYTLATSFASEKLQKDPEIIKISKSINYDYLDNFAFFLRANYAGLPVGPEGSRGYRIVNLAKNFQDHQLVDRPYLTKWEEIYQGKVKTGNYKLTANPEKNYGWKVDFAEYPTLIKAIEDIFKINMVDQNTIDSLNTISLWKISDKPKVMAFDLYLLRSSASKYLKEDFSNIILLSAIAIEQKGKWNINIVDSIFDADLKMNMSYQGGHKRYRIWDIYKSSEKDPAPKILFKVEDKDAEYFELFAKQPNGRYVTVFRGGGYDIDNF